VAFGEHTIPKNAGGAFATCSVRGGTEVCGIYGPRETSEPQFFDTKDLLDRSRDSRQSMRDATVARHVQNSSVLRSQIESGSTITRHNDSGRGDLVDEADATDPCDHDVADVFAGTEISGRRTTPVAQLCGFRHPSLHRSDGGQGGAENWSLHNQFPASIGRFDHVESMDKHNDLGESQAANRFSFRRPRRHDRRNRCYHHQRHQVSATGRPHCDGVSGGDGGANHCVLTPCLQQDAHEVPGSRLSTDERGDKKFSNIRFSQHVQTRNVLTHRRRHTIRAALDSARPLHVKNVPRLDWSELRAFVQTHATDLLAIFDASTKYFISADAVKQLGGIGRSTDAAFLTDDDIAVLIANDLIVEVSGDSIQNCCSFSVDEISKQRRRWILHPIILNEATGIDVKQWYMLLPDQQLFPTADHIAHAVLAETAWCFDFAAYFHCFPVLHNNFVFTGPDGKKYAACTIPTGSRQAPFAAQILTTAIARAACRGEHHVTFDCWIDNVRFFGQTEAVEKVAQKFRALTEQLHITLSEDTGPVSSYVYLGVTFNHTNQTVSIGPKTLGKLAALSDTLASTNAFPFTTIERDLSMCVWAHSIVHSSTEIYYLIKFYRRKCSALNKNKLGPHDVIQLWKDAWHQWRTWCHDLRTTTRRICKGREVVKVATLTTDASASGFGAVFRCGDIMRITCGKWNAENAQLHINLKELMAVRFGVEDMMRACCGQGQLSPSSTRLNIVVDNTSVIGRINNTMGNKLPNRSYQAYREVERIKVIARQFAECHTTYIKSASNEADYWSRVFEMQNPEAC
jgi:hypothetical protein